MAKWKRRISSALAKSIGQRKSGTSKKNEGTSINEKTAALSSSSLDATEKSQFFMEKTSDAVATEVTPSLFGDSTMASTDSESNSHSDSAVVEESHVEDLPVRKMVGGDAGYSTFLVQQERRGEFTESGSTRLVRIITVALTEDVPVYCCSAATNDVDKSTQWAATLIVEEAPDGDDITCSLTMKLKVSPENRDQFLLSLKLRNAGQHAELVFQDVIVAIKASLQRTTEFTISGGRTCNDVYNLEQKLNNGKFGTVYVATQKGTSQLFAVKQISRLNLKPFQDRAVIDEISIQLALRENPYIVQLRESYQTDENYYLVMELLQGGDLFDRLSLKERYSEMDARDLCKNLLIAVSYCHENSIVHCDLKPKNLMLASKDSDTHIKLCDFGLSVRATEPKSITRFCGTPYYVAPEILRKQPYDQAADMWSVGIIIYLLLSGSVPFAGQTQIEIFQKILHTEYELPDNIWGNVSQQAKDLIKNLLVKNPDDRYSAKDALNSPWLRVDREKLSTIDLGESLKELKIFHARMKFKAAVLAVQAVQAFDDDKVSSLTAQTVERVASF